MPGIGTQERGQDPDGRGLSGAVRAEQAEDGLRLDLQVHAVEGLDLTEVLDQPLDVDRRFLHGSPPAGPGCLDRPRKSPTLRPHGNSDGDEVPAPLEYWLRMRDPFLYDARQLLSETFEGVQETLDGLDAGRLNAKLDLEGANSLAVIAVHASRSARTWAAVAMGAKLPDRDRPAEFRTVVDSPEAFLGELRSAQGEALAFLDGEPLLPWQELRPTHPGPDGSTESVTGSWALLHAMEHAREHLSQMWLTRQAIE